MPERWTKPGSDGVLHPWPLVIAVTIMPIVGEVRAWNMPLPLAVSYWSAIAETHGDKSLISDEEYALITAAKNAAKE